jgi:hypothetical protein
VKTFLLLVLMTLLALIVVNRGRIYVRDPLAAVYKSDLRQDGRKDGRQSGVQVFVNATGDVLLWRDAQPGSYRILVQAWNKAPGTPMRLTCLRWMVCLADADHPSTIAMDWTGNSGRHKGKYDPRVSMSGREVSFVNGDGATVRVELR